MWSIVPYLPSRHGDGVYALWAGTFDDKWAVEKALVDQLFPAGTSFVAVDNDRPVGFVGTVPSEGSLAAILIERESRRRGIGRALFQSGIDSVRRTGRPDVVIGGLASLWKGVPTELKPACLFFQSLGCVLKTKVYDQYRFLHDYDYPEDLERDLAQRGIRLCLAEKADVDGVIEFERTHFPQWAEYFIAIADRGEYERIGCVRSEDKVLATALIGRRGSTFPGSQWSYLARNGVGAYATLGVDPARRGEGLGYALSAFATKVIKDSGAGACFLNYSEAVPLYRKLGFQDWAEYDVLEVR